MRNEFDGLRRVASRNLEGRFLKKKKGCNRARKRTGSLSCRDRKEQVERFNRESQLKVFLISIKAGGLGLNLTEADYVFILDPWWNPAVEAQAVDRAHRIGQKKKVFTYKFITRNTVEEKILTLQQRKLKLTTELITTEESFMKQLTKDDIEQMLIDFLFETEQN